MISFLLNIFCAFLGFCFVFLFINDTRVSEESFSQSFTLVSFFSPYLLFHSSFVFILLITFNKPCKRCHVFFLLLFYSSHSIFSLFYFSPTFILFSFYSLLLRFCKKKKKFSFQLLALFIIFLFSICLDFDFLFFHLFFLLHLFLHSILLYFPVLIFYSLLMTFHCFLFIIHFIRLYPSFLSPYLSSSLICLSRFVLVHTWKLDMLLSFGCTSLA